MTLCWKTAVACLTIGSTLIGVGKWGESVSSKGINNEEDVKQLASATQISIGKIQDRVIDNEIVNREQSVRIESAAQIQSMMIDELKELKKAR